MKLNSVTDVDRAGLCIGCGLCVGLFSDQQPKMHIGTDGFLHPKNTFDKGTWKEICQVCPGMQYCSSENIRAPEEMLWGPLVDAKIGHACDDMVRWLGSSGGGISSVLIYLLEKHIIDAVIQTGPDLNDPLRTATFLNFSKEDIILPVISYLTGNSQVI